MFPLSIPFRCSAGATLARSVSNRHGGCLRGQKGVSNSVESVKQRERPFLSLSLSFCRAIKNRPIKKSYPPTTNNPLPPRLITYFPRLNCNKEHPLRPLQFFPIFLKHNISLLFLFEQPKKKKKRTGSEGINN